MTRSSLRARPAALGLAVGAFLAVFGVWHLRPAPEAPKQPNDWFHIQRAWPAHDIPAGAWANALGEARTLTAVPLRSSGTATWTASGPTNVGGRITAIAVDPADADRVWIGAADGGVFRSTNGGDDWVPLLDDFGGLSIGALAHHPTQGGVLLAGTGEANASGDSYDGIGVLRTTDGGDTWTVAGLPASQRIGRIAWNPVDPSVIHAAVSGGLFSKGDDRGMYRSTDGGATWHQTLFVSDSTSAIDVALDPSNPDRVFAAFWERLRGPDFRSVAGPTSGIWRSTDGGDTWVPLTNGLPSGPSTGRIGLSVAASNPQIVYAIYADTPGYFDGVYKTTNGGSSWFRVDDGSDLSSLYSSFGWYFGNIRVSTTDPDELYALGVDLYRSRNGGSSWSEVTNGQHVDQHALWIDPANVQHVYCGNDGGFYESFNRGGSWTKKNTLPITQFYAITVDPQLPYRIYGGTQDNSTPRTLTGALDDWDILIGGDGFTVVIDPTDSDVIYGEYQWGNLRKSTNGGSSFSSALNGVSSSDRRNWHTPFVMDPNDHLTLYYGTYRVYHTTNGAGSWTAISPDLTDGPSGGNLTFATLTSLAVAPSAPSTIYAGSDDGNVHVTTNGGGTWTEIDAGLPVRYVTRVAVDPGDDAVAYVTFSGYRIDESLPHVFRTTNHGATWTDISGNLPQAPVNDIVVDPQDPNRLFVGTDVGVYMASAPGGSWQALGTGLPLSVVADLELHAGTRTLVAGTHGRSTFKLDLALALDGVDVPVVGEATADGTRLAIPAPNPARGPVRLAFSVPRAGEVRLTVHDVAGRMVEELHRGRTTGGAHEVIWWGRDASGRPLPAGVYFARLEAEGVVRTAKVVRAP